MAGNTAIGIGIGIPFKNRSGGDKSYLSPDVKEALVGVWDTWGKSNEDADRATIKNKISGRGGDFVLKNFAYKGNSGYGKYEDDFATYTKQANYIEYYKITNSSISCKNTNLQNTIYVAYKYTDYVDIPAFIPSYKVKVISDAIKSVGGYIYVDVNGHKKTMYLNNGINVLPDCYPTKLSIRDAIGFTLNAGVTITIEQLPEHPNSIVTDGVDDIIMSEKTVSEMVEGSDEITVVSMITNLDDGDLLFNNFLGNSGSGFNARNVLRTNNILSIVGYSGSKTSASVINTVLGDSRSMFLSDKPDPSITTSFFYPISWTTSYNKVAYRWTFIAKRVLTTDEINQVIAYYNLDRSIEPDMYYDVKKQGLTNSTLDVDWYLKDFSKNGRDAKLYNFGKRLNSGVGKYITSFVSGWTFDVLSNVLINPGKVIVFGQLVRDWIIYNSGNVPSYKVKITGLGDKGIFYFNSDRTKLLIDKDGIYEIAAQSETNVGHGFRVNDYSLDYTGLVIEQIPEHENGLVFDGVDDYAQYVGDLGLKDYTIVADRTYDGIKHNQVPIISHIKVESKTPFLLERIGSAGKIHPTSYDSLSTVINDNYINRSLSYQSTYKYNGRDIYRGPSINTGDGLTIGRYGGNEQYSVIVLYSLLLYPYSLSEFLIERQLKKLKLGTLYPNMVEWRPTIKCNADIEAIYYGYKPDSGNFVDIYPGDYVNLNQQMLLSITFVNNYAKLQSITSQQFDNIYFGGDPNGKYYSMYGNVIKSPQIITIDVVEYIRYEDIIQPYPLVLKIRNAKTQAPYTYGDLIPVGSEIMFISDWKNLLEGAYTWWNLTLNGETVEVGSPIKVTKDMVFSVEKRWILSTNEPKCIFSPRLFNIPNVGLKNLGYLPDISGHGNHGKMYNFAYTAGSGVGTEIYENIFNNWEINNAIHITRDDKSVRIESNPNMASGSTISFDYGIPAYTLNTNKHKSFTIKVTKFEEDSGYGIIYIFWMYIADQNLYVPAMNIINGVGEYKLNVTDIPENRDIGFYVNDQQTVLCDIELIPTINEDRMSFDGVDDYIDIPSTVGGKQVIMKCNWSNIGGILYDQRLSNNMSFAIFCSDNDLVSVIPAYGGRNNGLTYINGLLNDNIKASTLAGILHNIVVTNETDDINKPNIGCNIGGDSYSKMILYDFMLFDEMDDATTIKKLNNYIGIDAETPTSGGGVTDLTTWQVSNNADINVRYNRFTLYSSIGNGMFLQINSTDLRIPVMLVQVNEVSETVSLVYQYCSFDGKLHQYEIKTEGLHVLPESIHTVNQTWTGFKYMRDEPCNIILRILQIIN